MGGAAPQHPPLGTGKERGERWVRSERIWRRTIDASGILGESLLCRLRAYESSIRNAMRVRPCAGSWLTISMVVRQLWIGGTVTGLCTPANHGRRWGPLTRNDRGRGANAGAGCSFLSNGVRMFNGLVAYIEGLTLTQGRFAGESFKLHPWEKRFLRGFCRTEGDVALSVARGNGKSTLIAGIACAALDGPLMQPNSQVVVVASSFDQGQIVFQHAKAFLDDKIAADPGRWRIQDNSNRAVITDKRTRSSLRCLGSDPRRMHGLAPSLLIGDELAQWETSKIGKALAALQTSMGKIEGSRAIWIGTRAAESDHPFEMLLKGGAEYAQVHSAGKADPPFRQSTWRKANPGLRFLPDLLATLQREARRARRDPSALASFKALRLNLGVSDTVENILISADAWERCEVDVIDRGGPYVLGLDLGQNAAMSAAAGFWPDTGGLDSFAVFPETPGLLERGQADGVDRLYCRCADRGELLQAGLRVSDVSVLLDVVRDRWGAPGAIVCDRWREAELRQCLDEVGMPVADLVVRGMGYRDGGEDVRDFRKAVLTGKVSAARSLLMRSALSGARVAVDPAGNAKLAKGGEGRRPKCRDDAAAAAILAVAEGYRRAKAAESAPAFDYAVIG